MGIATPRPTKPARVFLTGGSGLLGSHIAEHLLGAGHEVVALQRPTSNTGLLHDIGCTVAEGDVRDDPDELSRHMCGCRWLVHCAALVYRGNDWPGVRAVNVEGTRNVLEAGARARLQHAVHVSSVAAYGEVAAGVSEDGPLDGHLRPRDLYGRSKRMAEAVAREVHESGRMEVTIVRPSAVYGERDRLFAPKLARLLRLPLVPVMGSGDNTVPVVYAGNVAAGVLAALDGRGAGGAFDLAQDRPLTQMDLLTGMAAGMGCRPRFLHVPAGMIRGAAQLGDALGVMVPGAEGLSASRVARLGLRDNPYSSDRARRVLGWSPPLGHDEALDRTGEWISRS